MEDVAEFVASDAYRRGRAAAGEATAPIVAVEIDTAAVGPCPSCGDPTRRLTVPIKGSGLDRTPADRAWCKSCLQAACVAAADEVRARR